MAKMYRLFNNRRTIYWSVAAMVISYTMALLFHFASQSSYNPYIEKQLFENKLHNKIALLQQSLLDILKEKNSGRYNSNYSNFTLLDRISSKNEDGFGYVLTDKKGVSKAWSKDAASFFTSDIANVGKGKVQFMGNGWYYFSSVAYKDEIIWGSFRIKQEYPYQNNYLSNAFSSDFRLSPSTSIVNKPAANSFVIKDVQGNVLFGLNMQGDTKFSETVSVISIIFTYLFLLSLFVVLGFVSRYMRTFMRRNLFFALEVIALLLFYYLFSNAQFPQAFFDQELFTASYFAYSSFLPSLGSFVLLSVIVFFLVFQFQFLFREEQQLYPLQKIGNPVVRYAVVVFLSLLFLTLLYKLIVVLVNNSSDLSIYFKVTDYDFITYLKLSALLLLVLGYQMFTSRLTALSGQWLNFKYKMAVMVVVAVSWWFVLDIFGNAMHWSVFLFYFVVQILLLISDKPFKPILQYLYFIGLVTLFSLFLSYTLLRLNIRKEERDRKLMLENIAINLTKETDLNAELRLGEVEGKMLKDRHITDIVRNSVALENDLRAYVSKKFFSADWDGYDLQIIGCFDNTNLRLDNSKIVDCSAYFEELKTNQGQPVINSKRFSYIDTKNGRVTYMGILPYRIDSISLFTLYVTLESKIYSEGLGYPELLKSTQELQQSKVQDNYSYAKYVNNALVKRVGETYYPIEANLFNGDYGSIHEVVDEVSSHLVLHSQPDTTIVLSRFKIDFRKILLVFSLIFTSFFFVSALLFWAQRLSTGDAFFKFSIQQRIQVSFIALVLVLTFLVILGSISLSIYRFKAKKSEFITQKVKSILLELEGYYSDKSSIKEVNAVDLNNQLSWLSNVFNSDINLYAVDGKLYATSRSVLFDKRLIGRQMDSQAYVQLAVNKRRDYIQEEFISKMHYTSAYTVLYNKFNRPIAYINVPYFMGDRELKEEVTSLLVAIVNFSVFFLVFVIAIAILVSGKITEPVALLQKGLEGIKIGEKNSRINYPGDDEVGRLIEVYNQMVDKLEESARQLAQSEREQAWREMAKQVAHEIKNPLTPMKLNIQQLLRAWNDKKESFDVYINKVSATLVEQIDNLSTIATEFSHFARMSDGRFELVDVYAKLSNLKLLFEVKEDAEIHLELDEDSKTTTYADNDQLTTVFNNLIKNAIQSTSGQRKAKIHIRLFNEHQRVVVQVRDNGLGVPKAIQHRLFEPSFTTKSSGMGLGLAICKRIVEASDGTIAFTTIEGVGSTFEVRLPLKKEEELT